MTDTQTRPAWHTTADSQLAAAREEIRRLTERLAYVEGQRALAEEAAAGEREATLRALETAQDERDRADGAEAHLVAVLARFVVEPAGPDLPDQALESIAETIRQDMERGLKADDIDAAVHVQGWGR